MGAPGQLVTPKRGSSVDLENGMHVQVMLTSKQDLDVLVFELYEDSRDDGPDSLCNEVSLSHSGVSKDTAFMRTCIKHLLEYADLDGEDLNEALADVWAAVRHLLADIRIHI